MRDNKEILNTLNDMLDAAIAKRLKDRGRVVCEKELLRVRGVINFAFKCIPSKSAQKMFLRQRDVFQDVYETLNTVMKKIDDEGKTLNTELHGVQNYSAYELVRIEEFAYKNKLREALALMLKKIPPESIEAVVSQMSLDRRKKAEHQSKH